MRRKVKLLGNLKRFNPSGKYRTGPKFAPGMTKIHTLKIAIFFRTRTPMPGKAIFFFASTPYLRILS
jgi:hypothetical protein